MDYYMINGFKGEDMNVQTYQPALLEEK